MINSKFLRTIRVTKSLYDHKVALSEAIQNYHETIDGIVYKVESYYLGGYEIEKDIYPITFLMTAEMSYEKYDNLKKACGYQDDNSLPVDMSNHHVESKKGPKNAISEVKASKEDQMAQTQKARGLEVLRNSNPVRGATTPSFKVIPLSISSVNQSSINFPIFARPCPLVPRHGFVDSRVVNNKEELKSLVEETRKADPQGEILLMQFLEPSHSAVWTRGSISIGTGNDGATSGHGSITLPTVGDLIDSDVCYAGGITEAPYVEMVYSGGSKKYVPFVVQLRNGPQLPMTTDYIPVKTEVKRVVRAEGDLLEWEAKVKAMVSGDVIYHPDGSLASHYAVHGVSRQIPVMVSREPKVGETLNPPEDATPKVNVDKLRHGFSCVLTTSLGMKDCVYLMLAGLHNASLWAGKHDFLLGCAMGASFRLAVTACFGEARHSKKVHLNSDRHAVYTEHWENIRNHRSSLTWLFGIFMDHNWAHGYGGKKWAAIVERSYNLYQALSNCDASASISTFNALVHSVHNSAWAFNKFIETSAMDHAASKPSWPVVLVAPLLYEMEVNVQKQPRPSFAFRRLRKLSSSVANEVEAVKAKPLSKAYAPPKPVAKKLKSAQCVVKDSYSSKIVHVQYKAEPSGAIGYNSFDVKVPTPVLKAVEGLLAGSKNVESYAGSGKKYAPLTLDSAGAFVLYPEDSGKLSKFYFVSSDGTEYTG